MYFQNNEWYNNSEQECGGVGITGQQLGMNNTIKYPPTQYNGRIIINNSQGRSRSSTTRTDGSNIQETGSYHRTASSQ
jgi:hypothetical protein